MTRIPLTIQFTIRLLATVLALAATMEAFAQEAAIRKNLTERIPQFRVIDEIKPSAISGLYEIRVNGSDIYYSDAQGDFFIQGSLIDAKSKINLTRERVNKLLAIQFDTLPLKDSFTIVRGKGERKLAIFEDPNCGYCKQFERGLQKLDNVTIHIFLYPILSADSLEKSKGIWCAADRTQAWLDWMVRNLPVQPVSTNCDSTAVSRNLAYGSQHKISGTPTILLADGTRVPGAIDAKQLEGMLTGTR